MPSSTRRRTSPGHRGGQTLPRCRGEGIAYLEFDGEWALRRVEVYGDRWFDSRTGYHPEIGPGLVDQPFTDLGITDDEEISAEEFEKVWQEALRR